MKTEEEYMDWEKDAPLLGSIKNNEAFAVPENYFVNLSDQIKSRISLSEIDNRTINFTTPDNYFETLTEVITSQIALVDIQHNNSGFNTPNEYFENSKTAILAKTTGNAVKRTKTIKLSFIRYAAAACILLSTSVGIYLNIKHNNNVAYQLSKIADEDIESYLQSHIDPNDLSLIIENLEETNKIEIKNSSINNTDIQEYLEQTP